MAFKRNKKLDSSEMTVPNLVQPALDAHASKVSEHIARLEQRHRTLVEETAQELEILKHQLNKEVDVRAHIAEAQQPLLQEIAGLRSHLTQSEAKKLALETEIQRLHKEYQSHYGQLQGALGSLKSAVKTQAEVFDQQVRLFSLDTDQAIDELLGSLAPAAKPVPVVAIKHESLPTVTDENLEALLAEFSPAPMASPIEIAKPIIPEKVKPAKAVKIKKEKKLRSFKGFRRLAVRTLAFALVGLIGWSGLKYMQKNNLVEAGQVAGVSTEAPNTDGSTAATTPEYKEAYATVPFDQTEWTTSTDPDFGISIRWPKNASNRIKTPGGTNIWFMRYEGFYMRITLDTTNDLLDDWWAKNSGFYTGDITSKGTFKNKPAWIAKSAEQTKTSGTTYIVQVPTKGIMQIWVKDEDPTTDDGQRLAKMIDSLSFATN